jgi:hypothetical protein
VRAEVAGPRVLALEEVRAAEERTAKAVGESVDLSVRARTDVMVTSKQYQALGDVRLSDEGDAAASPDSRSPAQRDHRAVRAEGTEAR